MHYAPQNLKTWLRAWSLKDMAVIKFRKTTVFQGGSVS